ncbi:hypothetical protein [Actinoplanes sp. NPDC051494]
MADAYGPWGDWTLQQFIVEADRPPRVVCDGFRTVRSMGPTEVLPAPR